MAAVTAAIVSVMLLVLGLSYAIRPKDWARLSMDAMEAPHRFFPLVLFILVFGLAVIATHNIWVTDLRVAVTIMGWIMATKAVVFLLYPGLMGKFASWPEGFMIKYIRVMGVLIATLGALLVYKFF